MALAFKAGTFEYTLKEDRNKEESDPTRTTTILATLSEHEQADIDDALEIAEGDVSKIAKILGTPAEDGQKKDKDGKGRKVSVNTRAGTRTLCILRIGLRGWLEGHGPIGADGKPTPWVKAGGDGMCAWENIRALQPKHRSEVAAAIETGNRVSEDEEKN